MATNHNETAAYLSEVLGKKSIVEKDRRTGRKTHREVPVMDGDQVKRFLSPESGRLIVTRAGHRALKLINDPFFKALPVWRYAPDPDHREKFLRRIFRFFFDWKGRAAKRTARREAEHVPKNIEPVFDGVSEEEPSIEPEWSENVISFPNQPKGDQQ